MAKKDKHTDSESAPRMKRKEYEVELRRLHAELVAMQEWVKATGAKICVVFEGRDSAGKGGTIKAITEKVSPRVFRIVALPSPTEREKSQMYVQRYMPHLPAAGEVVIFDRSWYNRAGVERGDGILHRGAGRAVPGEAPGVEQAMVDSGIVLVQVLAGGRRGRADQAVAGRVDDPRKIWKLSPAWTSSRTAGGTTTPGPATTCSPPPTREWAPWYVVHTDDKRRGRLNLITHLLSQVPYEPLSPKTVDVPRTPRCRELRRA